MIKSLYMKNLYFFSLLSLHFSIRQGHITSYSLFRSPCIIQILYIFRGPTFLLNTTVILCVTGLITRTNLMYLMILAISSHLKSFLEPAVPPIRLFLIVNMMPLKRCVVKGNYFTALLRNEARNKFLMSGP